MNFELDDDQRMLKDSLERLVTRDGGFERRRQWMLSDAGHDPTLWARYAELGLIALPYPAAHGGLGGTAVDTMLVFESLARSLPLGPLLPTMVIGAAALHAASHEQAARWVPAIASGATTLAWAHGEAGSRGGLHDVACSARRQAGGWRLAGAKPLVAHGDRADRLLVSARVAGDRRERDGIALFMVDGDAPGVARRPLRLHDGRRAADIVLSDVRVDDGDVVGEPGRAAPAIERVAHHAIAALAAEAVGLMSALLDTTTDYLKTRQQFGGPIARFQALQHRAADMLVALEQARSMALYAALMLDERDDAERSRALSAVKVQVGESARFVGQQAIQLHGGIGMTDEYVVGHWFKRLTVMESEFGDTDHHLAAFARSGGFVSPLRKESTTEPQSAPEEFN
jgi:alkylation response protein AidB-like acyl-CoA dehydrogenase